MNNKNEIYLKLTSNIIIDFFKNYTKDKEEIIFNEAECLGYKSIRFSTIKLNKEFKPVNKSIGYFKNGHFAYFEIIPNDKYWLLSLNVSKIELPIDLEERISNITNNIVFENDEMITFYSRVLASIDDNDQIIISRIKHFLDNDLNVILDNILDNRVLNNNEDIYYIEGALDAVFNNKYERNQEARLKCIEHYGAKCQICGFDFEEKYGKDFKGKIEVHHKVPLSEIRNEYIVNPIKDLIPVCPNCHMILHSKKDGTYTVDEVKEIIKKKQGELL